VRSPTHVVVVGLMGSGKTTLGKALAERLGRGFVDSDQQLRRTDGRTARQIEAQDGVDELHRLEAVSLLDALREPAPSVIAAAASTIEDAAARDGLARDDVLVIWLRGSAAVLARRAAGGSHRPAGPLAELREQVGRREPLFDQVADITVDVDDRTPAEVLEEILAASPD
jgi:shikimate kinase